MQLEVTVLNPKEIIFEGKAKSLILPGEQGVFEILPFHKRFLSRLLSGVMFIDDKNISIKRGIVKVDQNRVTVIVEESG